MLYNEKNKLLTDAYREYTEKQNDLRIDEQEKQYAYYSNDADKIEYYLKEALKKSFDIDDINEMQLDWINITKKLIDQLAIVYNQPASRYFPNKTSKDPNSTVQTEEEKLTDYYNSILSDNVNLRVQKADRLGHLQNTSLTQVAFNRADGKINYIVDSSHKFSVEVDEDDPYKIIKVSYPKYFKNSQGQDELFTVVWTDTEHYREDQGGGKHPIGDNEKMVNPYGIIPVAIYRKTEGEDFWGEGANDVIKTNEQINFFLTILCNEHILLGGAGTILAVNCNFSHQTTDKNGNAVEVHDKVKIGRGHPKVVDNVDNTMKDPRLEHVNFEPLIENVLSVIDWRIKMIALMKGLNPNSFLADAKASSGYSKIIDSLEQLEIRKDDLGPCRAYEKQLFKISRIINNTHAKTKEASQFKLQVIPEDIELVTDFAEIEIEKTVDEQIKEDEFNLKYNIISVTDIMMRENPDLTKEQAENLLKENKRIKDSYVEKQPVKTLGQIFNTKQNGDVSGQ